MKGTLFSADFVKDNDGKLRLLELNTDTTIIESIVDNGLDYSDFIKLLSDNNITRIHCIYKGWHKIMVDHLEMIISKRAPFITEFIHTAEENQTIYPINVENEPDIFILRFAYDEAAIFDSNYTKTDFGLYNIFQEYGDSNSIVELYHSSSVGFMDNLPLHESQYNVPDYVVRPTSATKSSMKWYKMGKNDMTLEERVNEFKSTVANENNIIVPYYKSNDNNKVSSFRSFQIVYGDNLDICYIGEYEIQALLELPDDISDEIDDSKIDNKLGMKHYYEYATNDFAEDEGMWSEENIIRMDGGYNSVIDAPIDDEFLSYHIEGSPNSDLDTLITAWSHDGDELPSGSFITSSFLQSSDPIQLNSNIIRNLKLSDNTTIRLSGGSRVLAWQKNTNQVKYLLIRELESGDMIFNKNAERVGVDNHIIEIIDTDEDGVIYSIKMEETDNYILSGSNVIVHNSPCFAAGTEISMANGEYEFIEYVTEGDMVLTYNFDSKEIESKEVLKILVPLPA